jgi:hypothetical protein
MADEHTKPEINWREHHAKQAYADKNLPFEHYAAAYRTGSEGATKYAGRKFEEIENDLTLDYEKHRAGSGLPWDQARPAVKSAWDHIGGVIAPRDVDRGIRSGL